MKEGISKDNIEKFSSRFCFNNMRLVFLYVGVIIILLYNTGIVGDDFTFIKLETRSLILLLTLLNFNFNNL